MISGAADGVAGSGVASLESAVPESTGYLAELRQNGRVLLAASLGIGTSLSLFAYTNSVFAPHLLKEFGWSRAQFALVGLTTLVSLVALPFIGRFTDRFGVKRVATAGTALMPFCFIAYSQMNGSFIMFLAIFTAALILGAMTGALVYTRLVIESFHRSRGLALTIVNCAPAVLAMALIPLLNVLIEQIGWRSSYIVLGAFVLLCGIVAISLIVQTPPQPAASVRGSAGSARYDFALILRSRVFWIIIGGIFLCLLQSQLHSSQMNIMLLDQGLSIQGAANVLSIYAIGTIVGRIACGLALDRFSTPLVTFVSMALPAAGFLLLAGGMDSMPAIFIAMFLIGLSVGAESDLIAYLVARYFKIRIYNSALSLVIGCTFLASSFGSLGVSFTVEKYDSFAPFLAFLSLAIASGSTLFLLLPKSQDFEKIG